MFAAFAECLLNDLLSRICLLRFFKHNELKMSKTNFFQMAPRIYYCTGRKLQDGDFADITLKNFKPWALDSKN
jgi:hypothetical protein